MDDGSAPPLVFRKPLDVTRPCLTRMHIPVEFVVDDKHPVYPLSFWVQGKLRSYCRNGEYERGFISPLDIFNADAMPETSTQLPLAI